MSLLITGSVALDSVKTPLQEHHDLLGGSASYASVAASFFEPVQMVAIVGTDFPEKYLALYRKHGIDLDGLQIADGKTFRWSGEYEWDLNKRRTLSVELNVFETFQPQSTGELPAHTVRLSREHLTTTPNARAGAGCRAEVCRGRHNGLVDRDPTRRPDRVASQN